MPMLTAILYTIGKLLSVLYTDLLGFIIFFH